MPLLQMHFSKHLYIYGLPLQYRYLYYIARITTVANDRGYIARGN